MKFNINILLLVFFSLSCIPKRKYEPDEIQFAKISCNNKYTYISTTEIPTSIVIKYIPDIEARMYFCFLETFKSTDILTNFKQLPAACITQAEAKYVAVQLSIHDPYQRSFRLPAEEEVLCYTKELPMFDSICQYANILDTSFTDRYEYAKPFGFLCDDNNLYLAPIKSYNPDINGLYDVLGNVSEWLNEDGSIYSSSFIQDSRLPAAIEHSKVMIPPFSPTIGMRIAYTNLSH